MADSRLDEKLAAGHYYDYEQHVRTLFFKLKMRKRESEFKELIKRAMTDLDAHNQVSAVDCSPVLQKDLVVDILEIYFVEHVKKVANNGALDDFFVEICKFALQKGDQTRAQGVIERIIGHTGNQRYELADLLGQSYADANIHTQAYRYFFKSRNEKQIVVSLRHVIKQGYESEPDMFVARACLDMLIRSEDLSKADYILGQFKQELGSSSLLHAVAFIIEGLRAADFEFIKKVAMVDYAPAFKRDS